MPPPLELDPFIVQLTKMYQNEREKCNIRVTFKRTDMKPPSKKNAADAQYVCLVRATCKKRTIACKLTSRNYDKFLDSYNTILKGYCDALKKKEKKKN